MGEENAPSAARGKRLQLNEEVITNGMFNRVSHTFEIESDVLFFLNECDAFFFFII